MSTALAPSPKFTSLADYSLSQVHVTPTEMVIEPGMSENDYLRLGEALFRVCSAANFWVGDWIAYGCKTYGHTITYKLAAQVTGYTRRFLYRCTSVAKRFPPEKRRPELSFHHYMLCQRFPEPLADRLLTDAAELGLTGRQIYKQGRQELGLEPEEGSRFQRKKIVLKIFVKTYDALRARASANDKHISAYVAQIIEEHLVGRPCERKPVSGTKTKAWRAAVLQSIENCEKNKDTAVTASA